VSKTYDLRDYVDVPTRLRMALQKFPDLRVQETSCEHVQLGADNYLVCVVTVWRSADDPIPTIGSAAEPVPGRTPYTRGSERMVGFTSALGRALGYMGFGIDKSVASADEVRNARAKDGSALEQPFGEGEVISLDRMTKPQMGMIRALQKGGGWTDEQLHGKAGDVLGRKIASLNEVTKAEASKLIDAWKQSS